MDDLVKRDYVRQRIEPRQGDPYYPYLSDLLIVTRSLIPPDVTRSLDHGCGGSPYRSLFGNYTYHRVDLTGEPNLYFEYSTDALLPRELREYDFILSTQVLEHVENPTNYLQECYRVLKPGAHLLLTTPSLFEDRACLYDYWRWTAFGLRRLVGDNGLEVKEVKKVTTQRLCTRRRLHETTTKSFPHCRVVDANESGHDVYVVIAPLAVQHSD